MNRFPLPTLPCTCASLRRASRLLTQQYEEALRPLGLRASQFTVLQMLSLVGEANQGEIARTRYAITQSQELSSEQASIALTDVVNSYESLRTSDQVVQLYQGGYRKQAEDSRDISQYAYQRGAASLLDYLDAERSYRSTELAYRQALAQYMSSLEQLRQAVGTRSLP